MERFYGVVNCKSCPSPVYLVTARPVTHWTKFEPSSSREGELKRLHKKKVVHTCPYPRPSELYHSLSRVRSFNGNGWFKKITEKLARPE